MITLGIDKELEKFMNSEYGDTNFTIIQALIRKLEGYYFEREDSPAVMKLYNDIVEFFDVTETRPGMSIAYDRKGTVFVALGNRSVEQNQQWATNQQWAYLPTRIGVKTF